MRTLQSVQAFDLAGYRELSWGAIRPDENLLVGRNGSGKSTLLEAIVVGLKFLHGRRTGDLLTGARPDARIRIELSDGTSLDRSLGEIRSAQTPVGSKPFDPVLYVHESRRPKSRMGKSGRSMVLQHPTKRYEFLLNELRELLRGSGEGPEWCRHLLDEAASIQHSGHSREWEWVRSVLPHAGPNTPRPMSCGQYDLLFFLLDVFRARDAGLGVTDDLYLVIDNPDVYFHPALQVEFLEFLRDRLPRMQLFLASHSLKLVARAAPAGLFWISRDLANSEGRIQVRSVRDLAPGARGVFYDLYGDDTASAVLHMILGFESTEYLAYLMACALPCRSIERALPEADDQIQALVNDLREFHAPWTLLDVGAGAGDLLVGLERLGVGRPTLEYVAVQADASATLHSAIDAGIRSGRIAPTSKVVDRIDQAPPQCDAIVFANVCHALGIERLADWLAQAIARLRPEPPSRLVIHEVEVLTQGESGFLMWTPDDFREVLGGFDGLSVSSRSVPRQRGVPLHSTLLVRNAAFVLPRDLPAVLRDRFEAILEPKLKGMLDEVRGLDLDRLPRGLDDALRQRRRAFLMEQIVTISSILQTAGRLRLTGPPPTLLDGGAPAA